MQRYTVHNVPSWLQPLFLCYGWIGGLGYRIINFLFRNLCRIEYAGKEHIANTPNHILCVWHENLPMYFIAHPYFHKPNIWLTFQLWYMKPVHIMKRNIGIQELAYGASGHGGKAALQQVLARLKEGWSTFVSPDGPRGPLKVAKAGVLVMSLKTGTPIIPISFQVEKDWRIPSWDRKRYPALFSKLVVVYGEPVYVTADNFELAKAQITDAMNDTVYAVGSDAVLPDL